MIDEEIRKYILEGKWENQYPQAIEHLLAEVKQLREQFLAYQDFLLWVEEEHNEVFDQYERKDEL
jgi:hypothetical protein